jgi:multiple sugar transport system permease protein
VIFLTRGAGSVPGGSTKAHTSSVERMTVSVGVPMALVRGGVCYCGALIAACLITSVPLPVLYNFFLDRFIAGFTDEAIK